VRVIIDRIEESGVPVVAVRGELDLEGGGALREALLDAIGDGGRRVVVDLEGLDFIDSAGLGVLVGGLKRARTHDGDLVLVCTGRNVLKVLEVTGLMRVFVIHTTREAAIAGGPAAVTEAPTRP
jgi:anti-sigma B factor antagonist